MGIGAPRLPVREKNLIKFTKKAVSFTRNKVRWTIVIAVMLVMLFIVFFKSSMFASRITVSCLGQGAQPSGKLNGGSPLIQAFEPKSPLQADEGGWQDRL